MACTRLCMQSSRSLARRPCLPACELPAREWAMRVRAPLPAGTNATVFAYAAAQVKKAMEVTQELGGENYVFWGGWFLILLLCECL